MYPHLLHIYGPLWVNSYGLMIALGFLLFVYLMYKNPKRPQIISNEVFFNIVFVGLMAGIVGGRIFEILTDWHDFKDNWIEIFYPWVGGFGILGTIIGVLIVVPFYLKRHNVKILPLLDMAAIYGPLFQAIARLGCFLAGCCYGTAASGTLWCSVIFTNPDGLAPLNVALHPTQLYSSFASFLIFLIIYFSAKFFSYKNGQLIFLYLILESIARFTVDFWRDGREFIQNLSYFKYCFPLFSYSQLVALGLFIFAVIGFIYVSRRK